MLNHVLNDNPVERLESLAVPLIFSFSWLFHGLFFVSRKTHQDLFMVESLVRHHRDSLPNTVFDGAGIRRWGNFLCDKTNDLVEINQ